MIFYQNAIDTPHPDDLIPHALPWILEASGPYYRALLGSAACVTPILETWVYRASSEISIRRVKFLLSDSEFAGGFIALNGLDLRKARKADTVALLTSIPVSERHAMMNRMEDLSSLFSPVADDEYYLSKVGLNPHFRGKKLGRLLIDSYLMDGLRQGHTRYCLDVEIHNEPAIRCYRSAGFEVSHRTQSKTGTLGYYSMRYERVRA